MTLRSAPIRRAVALCLGLIGLAGGGERAGAGMADSQCLKCHGEAWIADARPEALAAMVRHPDGQPVLRAEEAIDELYTPAAIFAGSVHAGLSCTDCHQTGDRLPHDQRLPEIACGDCHSEVEDALRASAHGGAAQQGRARPTCTDCHGPAHEIQAFGEPRTHAAAVRETLACMECHRDGDDAEAHPAATYRENVHGRALFEKGLSISATCVDCHGAHGVLPAADPASLMHPRNVPQTCSRCHEGIAEVYYGSVHGRHLLEGDETAATCTSCHGSHGVEAVADHFLLGVINECSHCHIDLGRSYLTSYHGKAAHLGYAEAAVCSSCHGAHDILPPEDPASRVAEANLVATCGACHEGVNANFIQFDPHVDLRDRAANPEVFWTWLVMTTLLLGTLAVFIPHGLLWFQRTLVERLRHPRGFHGVMHEERWVMRFNPVHRITHALIIISFMGLVLTGFPLKYSHTEWALGITRLFGGIPMMGLLHRAFALITFAYVGVHVAFLVIFFWKHCPRPRRRYLFGPDSMVFSLRDLKDFIAMVRWFLWLGPRPKFDRWAYFEKFDYWGEIWGVIVIGGTGLMLWLPEFFTRWLPGWVLNCAMVVHSIEALLAASVIFLVHFFNTHVRPEKFPIDMVMLTGRMTESEMKEERGDEYARLVQSGELERRLVPPVALKWRLLGAVAGLMAFALGVTLIVLAITTEFDQIFG